MFKEFSDAELVIMWHRLNQHRDRFYTTYEEPNKLVVCLKVLEKSHSLKLWKKVNKECALRKINVNKLCKTVPIEVITYKDKEVPIE